MRATFLALTILATGGCASTSPARGPAPADASHKTPVARAFPSRSQRMIYRKLKEGQQVVGRTEVEGALIR